MRKILKIGTTILMSFTVLGGFQGVGRASTEEQREPINGMIHMFAKEFLGTTVHADTSVNVPDTALQAAIKKKLGIPDNQDLTQTDMIKITDIMKNGPGIDPTGVKNFEGIQYCVDLTRLSSNAIPEKDMQNPILPKDLSQLTKLAAVGFSKNGVDNEFVKRLGTVSSSITTLYLGGNHIYDMSPLNGKVSGIISLENQTFIENTQIINSNSLTLKVKEIKNIDGSTPTITPNNGGIYDSTAGTITWNGLNDTISEVSYTWQGKNSFSGTVKVPISPADGKGQAQVTYNVNTANPDDPTANPDFTVLIPTEYQLSNKQKVSVGAVALKDAKDVTQNYTGDKAVKVAVTSAKNFQFDNGGTYKLVGGNKADIPAEITLDKTSTSSEVNAQLTKEGSKTAAADMLTFNYTVQ